MANSVSRLVARRIGWTKASVRWSYRQRLALAGCVFVLPALLHVLVFFVYPIVSALRLSLTSYDLLSPPVWVGIRNYTTLVSDATFLRSVKVTLVYVTGVTVSILWLSLGMGLALSGKFPFVTVYRTIFFIPWVTSLVGLAVVWRLMYHPYGAWNDLIVRLGLRPIPWLYSTDTALIAIIIFTVWRSAGYFAVLYMVGIQAIPREYMEAAHIDGASRLQLFRSIIWPLLKPTTVFVIIISITSAMRHIDTFFLMTGGGPADSTLALTLFIYQEGFAFLRMGRATAASVLMLAMAMGIALIQLRLFRREGEAL